jgi:hypothetical protein
MAAGVMLTAAGLAGYRYGRAHPRSLDIARPEAARDDSRAAARR